MLSSIYANQQQPSGQPPVSSAVNRGPTLADILGVLSPYLNQNGNGGASGGNLTNRVGLSPYALNFAGGPSAPIMGNDAGPDGAAAPVRQPIAPPAGPRADTPSQPFKVSQAIAPAPVATTDSAGIKAPIAPPSTPAVVPGGSPATSPSSSTPAAVPSPTANDMTAANDARLAALQNTADNPPNALGATLKQANANRLAALQASADNPTPATAPAPAPAAASTAPVAPSPAPSPSPDVPNWVRDPMSVPQGLPSLYTNSPDEIADYLKTGNAPPSSIGPAETNTTPSQPGPKHPSLWSVLGQIALPLAMASLGRKNPGAVTSFYGGFQQGQAQRAALARQAQQDAQARAQQDFENKLALQKETDTATHHENQDTNTADKNAITKSHYEDMKARYGDQVMGQFDKDIAQYSGNPAAQMQIAQRYDRAHGTTEFEDSLGNGTGDSDKKAYDDARATIAQQRADDNSKYVTAHIDEIAASAGLKRAEKGYIDAKTGRVVPDSVAHDRMLNATADYLTQRSNEVVPLAQADIAYKTAMGGAATMRAETEAADVNAKIHRMAVQNGLDETRMQSIAKKDPDFGNWVKLYDSASNRLSTAQLMGDKGAVAAAQADVDKYGKMIGTRMAATGNDIKVPPITDMAHAPTQPPAGGKPTARSTDWKSGAVVTQRIERQSGTVVPDDSAHQCGTWLSKTMGSPGLATRTVKNPNNRILPDDDGRVPDGTIVFWPGTDGRPIGDSHNEHFGRVYTAADGSQRVQESTVEGAPKGKRVIRTDETVADITTRHHVEPQFYRVSGQGAPKSPPADSDSVPSGLPQKMANIAHQQKASSQDLAGGAVLSGTVGGQTVTFHVPRNRAEFMALTPFKQQLYYAYLRKQGKVRG